MEEDNVVGATMKITVLEPQSDPKRLKGSKPVEVPICEKCGLKKEYKSVRGTEEEIRLMIPVCDWVCTYCTLTPEKFDQMRTRLHSTESTLDDLELLLDKNDKDKSFFLDKLYDMPDLYCTGQIEKFISGIVAELYPREYDEDGNMIWIVREKLGWAVINDYALERITVK